MTWTTQHRKQVVDQLFRDDTGDRLHDFIYQARGECYNKSQLYQFVYQLPEHLLVHALQYTMRDTEWNDKIYQAILDGTLG